MRLATIRTDEGTRAVRVDGASGVAIEIVGFADVGALLGEPDWADLAARASGVQHSLDALEPDSYAPVVPRPSKIVCVGLNYRAHILEMGHDIPTHPTLFAKYAEALIGAGDDILVPREASGSVDWEGELVAVIGRTVRHAERSDALAAIAGYTVMNDVTVRGHQYRTSQWLQGKTFESTTPLGPVLVTADEMPAEARVTTFVAGERKQHAPTSDLVFDAVELVRYVSGIVTLRPGDLIATGTPGGVGQAAEPPHYLVDGEQVIVSIEGIGALRNRLRITDVSDPRGIVHARYR